MMLGAVFYKMPNFNGIIQVFCIFADYLSSFSMNYLEGNIEIFNYNC